MKPEARRTGLSSRVATLLVLCAWCVGMGVGVPADPLKAFRASGYEAAPAKDRAARRKKLGISAESTYA